MDGLSLSFNIGHLENRKNPNLEKEIEILNEWVEILEKRYNHKFTIVCNSTDYTTLQPEGCIDILRLKYGKSKWIKLFMTTKLEKELINDPRFIIEKNKRQGYWKSVLTDTNISKYFDILDEAFNWLIEHKI